MSSPQDFRPSRPIELLTEPFSHPDYEDFNLAQDVEMDWGEDTAVPHCQTSTVDPISQDSDLPAPIPFDPAHGAITYQQFLEWASDPNDAPQGHDAPGAFSELAGYQSGNLGTIYGVEPVPFGAGYPVMSQMQDSSEQEALPFHQYLNTSMQHVPPPYYHDNVFLDRPSSTDYYGTEWTSTDSPLETPSANPHSTAYQFSTVYEIPDENDTKPVVIDLTQETPRSRHASIAMQLPTIHEISDDANEEEDSGADETSNHTYTSSGASLTGTTPTSCTTSVTDGSYPTPALSPKAEERTGMFHAQSEIAEGAQRLRIGNLINPPVNERFTHPPLGAQQEQEEQINGVKLQSLAIPARDRTMGMLQSAPNQLISVETINQIASQRLPPLKLGQGEQKDQKNLQRTLPVLAPPPFPMFQ